MLPAIFPQSAHTGIQIYSPAHAACEERQLQAEYPQHGKHTFPVSDLTHGITANVCTVTITAALL